MRCCRHPLCLKCRAQTLRTAPDQRIRAKCPFCRSTTRIPASVVKRLMAGTCPSHATTIECDGGPPGVLAHIPCIEGHYDCAGSTVRLLSIAQERLIDALGQWLDKAQEAEACLTQQLGRLRGDA